LFLLLKSPKTFTPGSTKEEGGKEVKKSEAEGNVSAEFFGLPKPGRETGGRERATHFSSQRRPSSLQAAARRLMFRTFDVLAEPSANLRTRSHPGKHTKNNPRKKPMAARENE